jgi:hypothetical protein
VVLIVDSFSARGIGEEGTVTSASQADRVLDAFGALEYLAGKPFVTPIAS